MNLMQMSSDPKESPSRGNEVRDAEQSEAFGLIEKLNNQDIFSLIFLHFLSQPGAAVLHEKGS